MENKKNLENDLDNKITEIISSVSSAIKEIPKKAIDNYTELFHKMGFVQIPDIVNSDALADLFHGVIDCAFKYFTSYAAKERTYFNRTVAGHRFKRLFFEPRSEYDTVAFEQDEAWKTISTKLQLVAAELSQIVQPLINSVADDFHFKFGSIFYYGEEDFIGLHHDAHHFDRINAQFPLSFNTVGCIRILYEKESLSFYDTPGCLNLLGAKTWHEVPLITKSISDQKPARFNLTLRYTE